MRTLITTAAAALLALPALAAPTTSNTGSAKTTSTASKAAPAKVGTSKMAVCAKQWGALGDKGQVAYKDKAKGMKSKKGNSLSGYNAFTAECMKKA